MSNNKKRKEKENNSKMLFGAESEVKNKTPNLSL